jgi:hypothetical protein
MFWLLIAIVATGKIISVRHGSNELDRLLYDANIVKQDRLFLNHALVKQLHPL